MPRSHPRPWHRGSLFGDGPRRALDREQRARFRFLLNAHRRVRRISPLTEIVGNALLKRLGTDGQCDPSHDTLAADTGASSRTVRRATATMRKLGLLLWHRRLDREGWRTVQTSNAYLLVSTGENPAPCCDGQTGRETRKDRFTSVQQPASAVSATALAEAQSALTQRQRVIEARLLTRGGATAP